MLLLSCGCVQPSYKFGRNRDLHAPSQFPAQITVNEGGSHPRLDRVRNAIKYPSRKWADWFGEGSEKAVIEEERKHQLAVATSLEFLSKNDLHDVNVDVLRYDPKEQWRRLRANDRIHPLWKYTDGSLRVVTSSVLPGRVFGYDQYNPYTNTLAINSDRPALAVYEAAAAKDFAGSKIPGVYATTQYLPLVPIWQQAKVSTDALTYSHVQGNRELKHELYPTTYAKIGGSLLIADAYSVMPGASSVPYYVAPLISSVGRGIGYAAGKVVSISKQ
jgi:hypothetical protein